MNGRHEKEQHQTNTMTKVIIGILVPMIMAIAASALAVRDGQMENAREIEALDSRVSDQEDSMERALQQISEVHAKVSEIHGFVMGQKERELRRERGR